MTSSLALLGSFAIRVGGCEIVGLPRKTQCFIAYLALRPGRAVRREVVADLLWTNRGPEQARHSLRQMLVVLRRTPFGDLLKSNADSLWIEAGTLTVDAVELEAALMVADPEFLRHCVDGWRGGLLEGLTGVSPGFDEWLRLERARLAAVMAQVLRRLVTSLIAAGAFDTAVEAAGQLVSMDSLDEAAHRLLMECLARAGRRGEALQQFETCSQILRDELDVAPDAETAALAQRIRDGAWPAKPVLEPAIDAAHADRARADDPESTMPASGEPTTGTARSLDAAEDSTTGTAPPRVALRWSRGRILFAWTAVALGLVAGSVGVFALRPAVPQPPGLAFQGFRDISGAPLLHGALAGFVDLLQLNLANQQHLRLIGGRVGDVSGVPRYRLGGSTAMDQADLRVTARLIDVRDGKELWSRDYDVPLVDASRTADDIAIQTARAVAGDREIIDTSSRPATYPDAPQIARNLIVLGHEIDFADPGPHPASKQIYRLAVGFDKENVDALAHLANAYIRTGKPGPFQNPADLTEADAILRQALRLDPMNVYVLFNACALRRWQGRIAEALELCRRTLDIDPHYPGALRELGHDLLRSGDAEAAVESYRASIDAAPFLPLVFSTYKGLGVALFALGRTDDAVAALRKAMDLDKSKVDNEAVWLAAVLQMGGHHEEAADMLAEYLKAHPGVVFDDHYLMLLDGPKYETCRHQVRIALADAREVR